jgi:23S rRNA (adenine2030-N6)-methyltransferase
MLSYQHAYHAGNFVDCHKHAALCALITALQHKDSAITFYDFFAGRGAYSLHSPEANKTGEYIHGIAKIWDKPNAPAEIQPYLQLISAGNPDDLQHYPGSPEIMRQALRPQDRLICVDAHPQEFDALSQHLGQHPQITLHKRDAWESMSALLPPKEPHKTPRGLIVIDPAYEVKNDYLTLVKAMAQALQKFAHGVYLIWYPLLSAGHHEVMLDAFKQQITTKTVHSQLIVQTPQPKGLYGSGLLLINPPWQFDDALHNINSWLLQHLKQDKSAIHRLEWLVAERSTHVE